MLTIFVYIYIYMYTHVFLYIDIYIHHLCFQPFGLKSFASNDSSKQVMLALLSMALFAPGCVFLCLEHKSVVSLLEGQKNNPPKKRA